MKLSEIIKFLNELLHIDTFEDRSNNGLQVGGEKEVLKVGFAVDACLDTFKTAKENNCDLLITHHGISWGDNLRHVTGNNYQRIKYLVENNLALASYHLPLDAHMKYGNNIKLAELLKLRKVEPFDVGVKGVLRQDMTAQELANFLNQKLNTKCEIIPHGKQLINTLTIISGSGSSRLSSCNTDCLLIGDLRYGADILAKEIGMNVIAAGHYETETLGLMAIMKLLKVQTVFIDKGKF